MLSAQAEPQAPSIVALRPECKAERTSAKPGEAAINVVSSARDEGVCRPEPVMTP